VVFTIISTNLDDNSIIYWQIFPTTGNVDVLDFTDATLTGESIIVGNRTSVVISINEDRKTETTTEKFRLRLSETSFEAPAPEVVASSAEITIQDTSQTPPKDVIITVPPTVNEGETVLVQVTTANIELPTLLYWSISSIGAFNASDVISGSITGLVSIDTLGQGSFSFAIAADAATEGSESFGIEIYEDVSRTIKLKNSSLITVNDTSKTASYSISISPTSVDEGGTVILTVNATDVPDGTLVNYYVYPEERETDINPYLGSLAIISGTASISLIANADNTTEGTETYGIKLEVGGTQVFDSGRLYTILDTSTTTVPPPPPLPTGINVTPGNYTLELGETVNITIQPVNLSDVNITWQLFGTAVDDNVIATPTSGSTFGSSQFAVPVQIKNDVGGLTGTREFQMTAVGGGNTKTSGSITVNLGDPPPPPPPFSPGRIFDTRINTFSVISPTGQVTGPVSDRRWSTFMQNHAIWVGGGFGIKNIVLTYNVDFPYSGTYHFQYSVDDEMRVELDGNDIIGPYGGFRDNPAPSKPVQVQAGTRSLTITARNGGDGAGVALVIYAPGP
jgi:hypothetical protein